MSDLDGQSPVLLSTKWTLINARRRCKPSRRVVLTKCGRVVLALRRMRCQACRQRFRPADARLVNLQGGNITAALSKACIEAGASWPYATAAQVVKRLCGAQINAEQVRRLTNRAGSQEAARQATEAKACVPPTAAQVRKQREAELHRRQSQKRTHPELLQIGLDGGWIKSREHKKGMEGKVGVVVSEIEQIGKRGHRCMTRRRYVATFGSGEQVGNLTYAAGALDLWWNQTSRHYCVEIFCMVSFN